MKSQGFFFLRWFLKALYSSSFWRLLRYSKNRYCFSIMGVFTFSTDIHNKCVHPRTQNFWWGSFAFNAVKSLPPHASWENLLVACSPASSLCLPFNRISLNLLAQDAFGEDPLGYKVGKWTLHLMWNIHQSSHTQPYQRHMKHRKASQQQVPCRTDRLMAFINVDHPRLVLTVAAVAAVTYGSRSTPNSLWLRSWNVPPLHPESMGKGKYSEGVYFFIAGVKILNLRGVGTFLQKHADKHAAPRRCGETSALSRLEETQRYLSRPCGRGSSHNIRISNTL